MRTHPTLLGVFAGLVLSTTPSAARATTYDVGPGQARTALGQVPWQSLAPGDTVRIHAGVYHEKLWLTESGTAAAPIRVVGVPAADGTLPVIDGDDATSAVPDGVFGGYPELKDFGVVGIGRASTHAYGYRPSYIELSDLEIRGGRQANSFLTSAGTRESYRKDAAGLWIGGATHITLTHLTVDDNANGLFAKGLYGTPEGELTDLLVQRSWFHDDGVVGDDREHQVYTEGDHVTFEANHFDRPLPGSLGNNVKDRSAGTVFRFNWVDGGGHLLDLVDAQDSAPVLVGQPDYGTTDVVGNVFVDSGDAIHVIHYGGDTCGHPAETDPAECPQIDNYRKGLLRLDANTFILRSDRDAPNRYAMSLLDLDTDQEHADVRDNIAQIAGSDPGRTPSLLSVLDHAGVARVDHNWLSPGTTMFASAAHTGSATELGTLSNPDDDPGFVDAPRSDFRLRAGGQAVDAGIAPLDGAPAVDHQYVPHQGLAGRAVIGRAMDLGAFELGGASAGPPASCPMPSLIDLTLAQARRAAADVSCTHLTLHARRTGPRVVGQSVAAGTSLTAPTAAVVVRLGRERRRRWTSLAACSSSARPRSRSASRSASRCSRR